MRPLAVILFACLAGAALARGGDTDVLLRVRTLYPTANLRVWISDDGDAWRDIADSTAFWRTEQAGAEHGDYLFALPYLPARVRLGVTGAVLGRLSIDSVEAFVKGEPRQVLSWQTTGTVLATDRARTRDGEAAVIVHRGQSDTVSGFILGFTPTPPPAEAPLGPWKLGVYTGPKDGSQRLAAAIARLDFTVFQQGDKLGECVRRVKALNPEHRVVLRLVLPARSFLLYTYDPESREQIRRQVADAAFGDFAELVDTVSLSEEEPGNTFKGIYGVPLVPREVYLWKDQYQAEHGKPLAWPPTPEVNEWLGESFRFMLNDLYDYIHARYPHIKVYQWVELRGYGNRSGFPEYVDGDRLKMDGYVLEWGNYYHNDLVPTPLGKAVVKTSYFAHYLRNLRERHGLRPDQVLAQVWAHHPACDTLGEVEAERRLGMTWIYVFYPNAGTPGAFDLYGEADTPEWRFARETAAKLTAKQAADNP